MQFKSNDNYLFWGSFFYTDLAERLFRYFKSPSYVRCREITFDVFNEKESEAHTIIPLKYSSTETQDWILFYLKEHYVPHLKNLFGDDLKSLKDMIFSMASDAMLPGNTYQFEIGDWGEAKEEMSERLQMILVISLSVKGIIDCDITVAYPYGYAKERVSASFPSVPAQMLVESKAEETMAHITARFIASKDKPWNIHDYLRRLRDQEIQHFLLMIMSAGLRDKELSLLMVPLDESTRKKVIVNLSKHIQEEVLYHIPQISYTRLKAKDNKALYEQYKKAFAKADTIILDLLEKGKIQLDSLKSFNVMKENYEMSRLMDILKKNDMGAILKKNYEPLSLQKATASLSPKDLALSLMDADAFSMEKVRKHLSSDAQKRLIEDMLYHKKRSEQKDIFVAKTRFIKNIKRFCTVNILEQSKELMNTLIHYDAKGSIRKLLFQEVPMEFYARALQDEDDEFFEKFTSFLDSSRKRVFSNMLSQIRSTQNDQDTKRAAADLIIKKVKGLVDKEKIVFVTEDPGKRKRFVELLEI